MENKVLSWIADKFHLNGLEKKQQFRNTLTAYKGSFFFSKCGEVKLANERYFSPRSDDKGDGFYSYCRKCGQNYYKPDKVQ